MNRMWGVFVFLIVPIQRLTAVATEELKCGGADSVMLGGVTCLVIWTDHLKNPKSYLRV